MDKEQKRKLAKEVLENMNITKEQYKEVCKLCDELELEPKRKDTPEPAEESWDDVVNSFENNS